jgi:hypothetical protein
LGEIGVDGRIILKWVFTKLGEQWMQLDEDNVVVGFLNTAVNLRVTYKVRYFLTS